MEKFEKKCTKHLAKRPNFSDHHPKTMVAESKKLGKSSKLLSNVENIWDYCLKIVPKPSKGFMNKV